MGEHSASAGSGSKKIPIILVPGIAGSRLTDPATGNLVWNPTGTLYGDEPGSFAANVAALRNVNHHLIPDETHQFYDPSNMLDRVTGKVWQDKHHQKHYAPIRHFYNVICHYYGGLASALHYKLASKMAPRKLAPVVYCCGYDWRQSNAKSAQRLQKIVAEAQKECNGEKAVIVAHSMGTIVARHYCKNLGGEAKTHGLIVIGGPTLGAIKAYVMLKEGFPFWDKIRRVLSLGAEESRDFLRGFPAIFELLPTHVYCSEVRKQFATFDKDHTGLTSGSVGPPTGVQFTDNSNGTVFYLDPYTGLTGEPDTRTAVQSAIGAAETFDLGLRLGKNAYMHPRTLCYYTKSHDTDGQYYVHYDGRTQAGPDYTVVSQLVRKSAIPGDGTVPADSARPTFIPQKFKLERTFGSEHVDLSGDSGVINAAVSDIVNFLLP